MAKKASFLQASFIRPIMSYKVKIVLSQANSYFRILTYQIKIQGNVEAANVTPPAPAPAPLISDPDPRYHGTELVMLYDYKVY